MVPKSESGARGGAAILVVDDDLDIRELVAELLEELGFSVESAANGEEALVRLSTSVRNVGLIFLDLMMPVMNGWELAVALKQDPQYQGIPLVLLSADRDVRTHSTALGAQGFLQKPIELKQLLEFARRYC